MITTAIMSSERQQVPGIWKQPKQHYRLFVDTWGGAQKPSRRPADPHSSPEVRGKAPPGGWKERSLSCNVLFTLYFENTQKTQENPHANAGDVRDVIDPASIPGSGRFPGRGNDNPLQHSYLEDSTNRGAWPRVGQNWAYKHIKQKTTKVWT